MGKVLPRVRLFVSDIDGCLSEPFAPLDLDRLGRLRRLAGAADEPTLTLCTGRPLGYAEAMAQLLDLRGPFLFEAGAGMYDLATGVRGWHPSFGPEQQEAMAQIQAWLEDHVQGTSMAVDRGKFTQAGIIGADKQEIARALDPIREYVAREFPDFMVAHTPISVDILFARLTKREGLDWLAEETGIPLESMAFIGDTNGDLGALKSVGTSFAPANATEEVHAAVQTVTSGKLTEGVLQAFQQCIQRNASLP